MTTSRVCDALQLGRVLIKSGQMSALLRKRLNCCTFNGSALAANRCIGPPPTSYRRRRGWRRSEFVTARLSATNGRSLSRPRQRCRSRPGDSILRSSRQDGLRPLQELEYSLAAAQWLAQEQPTPCPRRMSSVDRHAAAPSRPFNRCFCSDVVGLRSPRLVAADRNSNAAAASSAEIAMM